MALIRSCRLLGRDWRRGDDGWGIGQKVFDVAVHLLLLANPLGGAAERGGDAVDALGNGGGIGRESDLLADQLGLFLDAGEFGFDELEFLAGVFLTLDALLND